VLDRKVRIRDPEPLLPREGAAARVRGLGPDGDDPRRLLEVDADQQADARLAVRHRRPDLPVPHLNPERPEGGGRVYVEDRDAALLDPIEGLRYE
jgi:hypothetical protein